MLTEKSAAAPVKSGARWRAILAVPGQGSSGKYSESVLRDFGPAALPAGSKAFLEHDPSRKVRDMIGTYPEGAVYEDGVGLVAELEPFSHWRDFVEEVGPHSGLSIYMLGEKDDEGNITALLPDRQNSVDMVSYPGLEGSGLAEKLNEALKLYESAHTSAAAGTGSASAATDTKKEEAKAMDEATKALIEGLFASLETKFSALEEKVDTIVALSESATAADAEKVDALEVAGKLAKAELTEGGLKRVLEAVSKDKTIDEALTAEKALREEFDAAAPAGRQTEGYVHGAKVTSAVDLGKAFG